MKEVRYQDTTILLDDRVWENLPVVVVGPVKYRVAPMVDLNASFDHDGFRLTAGQNDIVNKCECCGRFDTAERVARSWEEAEQLGWVLRDET